MTHDSKNRTKDENIVEIVDRVFGGKVADYPQAAIEGTGEDRRGGFGSRRGRAGGGDDRESAGRPGLIDRKSCLTLLLNLE